MGSIAELCHRLGAAVHDHKLELRLSMRVTVAALLSLAFTRYFNVPLAGLWAVLTAIVVTQVSVGGSLKATLEYLVGTLGGAVYAGAIAATIPHSSEVALLAVLALTVAPLSLLAALNPHFRVGPFTAVIVILGTTITHTNPIGSAIYRIIEVALGGAIGLAVSFLVLPARAHTLATEAAANMLEVLARALPELFVGFSHERDVKEVLQLQTRVGDAFARLYAVSADIEGERVSWLTVAPDLQPLIRILLQLRHDLVIVGRTVAPPLPRSLAVQLEAPIQRAVKTSADYLSATRVSLLTKRKPPPYDAVNAALDACIAQIATLRRDLLISNLSDDAIRRAFALSFALDQMRRSFIELARCLNDIANFSAPAARTTTGWISLNASPKLHPSRHDRQSHSASSPDRT